MNIQSRDEMLALPGLTLRIHDGSIAVAALMVPIATAANAAEAMDDVVTVEELERWLGHPTPSFDPISQVLLAEMGGELVGYAWVDWVDTTDGLREFRLGGYVHPDRWGLGIGRRLLARQESLARSLPASAVTDRPLIFGTWAPDKRLRKRRLFERAGYLPARYFFTMLRPSLDGVSVPPMPEGTEIRPTGTERASQKRVWDAAVEAFKDHWGGFDGSDAAFERSLSDPDLDPDLCVVAWDGDQIAGAVVNTIYAADNTANRRSRGWLDSVFVRRPWRRRGLAAALVARSLVRLREAGMSAAMLGVDAANSTGALGVYERAGFTVDERATAFRKPMGGAS